MRELIQELDTLMIRELYTGVSTWDELDEEDRATVVEAWEKAITKMVSAVRDGRLDEELGVVGRHTEALGKMSGLVYRCSTLTEWEDEMARRGATTIIALSGTSQRDPVGGEEEE